MTPKQKAKQKAHQIYDEYWSAVSRRPASNKDPLPDIRPLIERALIEAEETKAKEEREACAMIAAYRAMEHREQTDDSMYMRGKAEEAEALVKLIRARSQS